MVTIFAKFVSILLSVVMFCSTPINLIAGKKQQEIARAEENCRLSFAAISDIHLRDNFKLIFQGMLELGLQDFENADEKLDAVVFDGDITDHGYTEMWDIFAESVAKYDIAKNKFIVVGNHDTWGPDRDNFDDPQNGVRPTFIRYNKSIAGRTISDMYYSDIVNGYYFIALGSEYDSTDAYISDAQIAWLEGEMQKAAETKLPIFVFCHQPINQTHGLPYLWELDETQPVEKGGIGAQSAKVAEVLMKYDNVFYISGHLHTGMIKDGKKKDVEYASVEYMKNNKGNNITLINLPSYLYPDFIRGGHFANGCGYVIEAYDSKVMIRARNFAAGTWLTKLDVTVDLVK